MTHPDGEALFYACGQSVEEYAPDSEALFDPTGESRCAPIPFVYRKHIGKALVLVTSSCFSYCRFCFRRASPPSSKKEPSVDDLCAIRNWLFSNEAVEEVILSGGDPLTLDDAKLATLLTIFGQPPGVKRLRIHSRAPVVNPKRVTRELVEIFKNSAKPISMIIHAAHPAELRRELWRCAELLLDGGIGILNQSALLKGVNADPATLCHLISKLRSRGIETKYIHHTDRAPGNAKFRVSIREGLSILRKLSGLLDDPPDYVIDLPNGAGKFPVSSLSVVDKVSTPEGIKRRYRWNGPVHDDAATEERPPFEWWDITEQE